MKSRDLKFKYKANRDYVHGTDIYNYVEDVFIELFPGHVRGDFSRFTLNFVKPTVDNVNLFIGNKDEFTASLNKEEITFRGMVKVKNEDYVFWGIPNGRKVTERMDYDEKTIESNCKEDNDLVSFDFTKSPLTPIEKLIPIHKFLLAKKCPGFKGKWLFTRLDLDHFLDRSFNGVFQMKGYQLSNPKLVCSDLLIDNKKVGRIFFSLI